MFKKVLVANRGEIALRLVRALRDLDIASVAVYAQDDAQAAHVRAAAQAVALTASGPGAYLDAARLVEIGRRTGCDAGHPGYGFLSERADFAQACRDAGLTWIGPDPQHLALFGDKAAARALALRCGVALMPGTQAAVSLEEAQAFLAAQHGAGIMVKAIGGGGGRGMRAVLQAADLPDAYARCVSEAGAAFGVDGVYVERFMPRARHIEIQILGDGQHAISLGERECSLQRRFQKLVEIAPSPCLSADLRAQITEAALKMAREVGYRSLGTFEFLVDPQSADLPWVFMEANPRLQVEHTVTEEVTGLDLVQLQLAVAAGRSLHALGLDPQAPPVATGFAIQWRINAETLQADGQARPSAGTLERFDVPSGPGIRVDTHGYAGATPSPHYDTLLAKLIVSSRSAAFADASRRARRALAECRIEGLATNLGLLQAIAARPEWESQAVHTGFVQEHLPALLADAALFDARMAAAATSTTQGGGAQRVGAKAEAGAVGPGLLAVRAPMPARLVQLDVALGDVVPQGAQIAVLEAMKMEHVLLADAAGQVVELRGAVGSYLGEAEVLVVLQPVALDSTTAIQQTAPDLACVRADLQKVIDRHAYTLDANRQAAVAKRHAQGGRTARENLADLCDAGSFIEYGALAIAAQTRRRSVEDLVANTPADGMVTGIGTVNAAQFGQEKSRCVLLAYDYMVLAGTQGAWNHQKKDRMFALAHQLRLPVVLFAEGGGGRPGDIDLPLGLNNHTFGRFAGLSGKVPVVGIAHGRCFAGNAALLGCCDVIIATAASNIGMGGPAMVEGGGLGSYRPEDIGPSRVQAKNGVIDILVQDEPQAVRAAQRYLSYFQGPLASWECADQRLLRHAIPEHRLRVYDIRAVLRTLVDQDSLLELRQGYGAGIVTALARIQGRPVGILANNPQHLGGAIDADAADKSARFMQLCNAHGLPIVSLVDTPGFMVGPDIEAQAQVRHVCRMFVVAAQLRVPFFSVVLRKGYGLGAQAMTAGGFDAPVFTVSWPTGEFGPMGLEGGVMLGYRKELEATAPGAERDALFSQLLAQEYAKGEAIRSAQGLEIDAVIDPLETRDWLVRGLESAALQPMDPSVRFIDTW
ncbi:MAG TPA: carboxyl transferase domain-containing protein [Pseudorhodoferax sp.]|nr:carboxyl transferase domain-containing protein [Pseudorhodoferax sp.]